MIKPFLKWPGGKGKLLPLIESLFPTNIKHYVDPFLGGGSTFLRFAEINGDKCYYYLNDLNSMIPLSFKIVKENNEKLSHYLSKLAVDKSKERYYRVRSSFNHMNELDADVRCFTSWSTDQTANLIYLNRTCFNGLYRVNSRDEFNVPYGYYKNPDTNICDLRINVSALLNNVEVFFSSEDFFSFVDYLVRVKQDKERIFVYLDPPYEPLVDKQSFTAYTSEGFGREDQERVASLCEELNRNKILFMLHNSNTPYINERYSKFNIMQVEAPRSIARTSREPATEVIIRNYS
jgi:DNA adenine methylase